MPRELAIWEGEIFPVVAMGEVLVTLQLSKQSRRIVAREDVILLTEFLREVGCTFWEESRDGERD